MKYWALATVLLTAFYAPTASARPAEAAAETMPAKSRVIVLSDIENEPDDTQSFIRLLLYANEIDIEAMVATTSTHMRDHVHPESIRRLVAAYGQVRPNLVLHASGYPTAKALEARIFAGQPGYGVAATGPGRDTEGSRRIIAALDAPDPRPLWVSIWGGANTLAQALRTLQASRSPEEVARLVAKLRVYTISDQDDAGAWIRKTFPDLFYIVSPGGYGAATWTGIHTAVDGLDNTSMSNGWLADHVQQGHGPLGAAYPDVGYGMEGDTPAFLNLIPNGLSDPEHPEWGGWGGRYELYTPKLEATDPKGFTGGVPVERETRPIWTNAVDAVSPPEPVAYGKAIKAGTHVYKDYRATIWRWRDAFQNDFAARIGWTTLSYGKANHPPIVRLDHADRLTVRAGQTFVLSAKGSADPDGDSLSYYWFHYPEAGSWKATLAPLGAENVYRVAFLAPEVTRAETAHFVVAVTDKGAPPLTRYRRVIVTILPKT